MFGYPNEQANTAYGHDQTESPLSPIGRDRDILQDRLYDTDPRERSRLDPLASPSTISGRFSYPSALDSPRSTLQSPNEKTRFIPNFTQPATPATPTIKRWPNEPKRLKRNDSKSWNFWYEIIRFIAALGFVSFGIVAYVFKETDLDTCAVCKGIVTTCSYLPTAFPIAYTALTGASLQHIALALAVKGTRLVAIEQLLQYNSVGSALITPFKMLVFDRLSYILIILWAFSPIGGQGGLRMLEIYNATSIIPDDSSVAYYIRPNATTLFINNRDKSAPNYEPFSANMAQDPLQFFGSQIDNLFRSALVSTLGRDRRSFARDNLGNVRIPMLSSLKSAADRDGWVQVPPSESASQTDIRYSSFLGIPITTNSTHKRSTISLETSYFEFSCREGRVISDMAPTGANPRPELFFNISSSPLEQTKTSGPLEVLIQSFTYGRAHTYQVDCSLTEPRLEVNISCVPDEAAGSSLQIQALDAAIGAGNCEATSMRPSRMPSPYFDLGSEATFLDHFEGFRDLMFANFPLVGRFEFRNVTVHGENSDFQDVSNKLFLPEAYLLEPSNIGGWGRVNDLYQIHSRQDKSFDLSKVPIHDFEARLTILFNSFLQSIQSPGVRSLGVPVNGTSYVMFGEDGEIKLTAEQEKYSQTTGRNPVIYPFVRETREKNLATTKNTLIQVNEQYKVIPTFFFLYMVSSVALLLSVLVSLGFVIKFIGRMAAPDVLGFFSSFTRDNPYIPLDQETGPNTGSAMDGTKRARLLKTVRVRLGDVQPSAENGHISLFREDIYGQDIPRLTAKEVREREYL